ncbi:hypothetical protein Ple7327_1453 [Pleurocapsa sp. PCC 7327]|nr:hypothetical protein Ple7327_1453 [Pleurocapsa sp. PCC 7327]
MSYKHFGVGKHLARDLGLHTSILLALTIQLELL